MVHDGPCPRTPGTGNTGTCLRPRRVPESGKLGPAPRLHRPRQCLLRHRLPPLRLPRLRHRRLLLRILGSGKIGVCLRPRRAPSSGKTMAAPRPRRLGLHRLRHRHPLRLLRRVSVTLLAYYAHAATSTPAPDHDNDHGTLLARLPRPRLHRPHALGYLDTAQRAITSPSTSSASSTVQATAPRHRPRRSRYYCGGMSAHWSTSVCLQSDRPRRSCCSRRYRYDCGGMLEYMSVMERLG